MSETKKRLSIILSMKDNATKQFSKLRATLTRLRNLHIPGVGNALDRVGQSLKFTFFTLPNKIFGTFLRWIKRATIAAAGLGAAFAGMSIKTAAELEATIVKLKTLSGFKGTGNARLGEGLLDITALSGRSLEEVGAAAFDIASALGSNEDALRILNQVARTSVGTFGDMTAITEGLVTSMNAFGASSDKSGAFLNVLLAAQDKGKTDFAGLASAMGQVAAEAANLGLSFEQTAGIVSFFSLQTSTVSEAATQLSSVLSAIGKNSEELSEIIDVTLISKNPAKFFLELDKVAKETGQSVIKMLGRKEASRGIAAAVQNTEKLIETLKASHNPAQTFEDLFVKAADTVGVKFGQLKGEMVGVFATFGKEMEPTVKRALDSLAKLFQDNSGKIQYFAFQVGKNIEAFVNLALAQIDILVSSFSSKDRRKSFFDGMVGSLKSAATELIPVVALAYFEVGRTMWSSIWAGFQSAMRSIKPEEIGFASSRLEDQIGALQQRLDPANWHTLGTQVNGQAEVLGKNVPTFAQGFMPTREQVQTRLKKLQGELKDVSRLVDLGQKDTVLLPLMKDLDASIKRVAESATLAGASVRKAFENVGSGLNGALGPSAAGELSVAFDNYLAQVDKIDFWRDAVVSAGDAVSRMSSAMVNTEGFALIEQKAQPAIEALKKLAGWWSRVTSAGPSAESGTGTGDPGRAIPGATGTPGEQTEVFEIITTQADQAATTMAESFSRGFDAISRDADDAFSNFGTDILRLGVDGVVDSIDTLAFSMATGAKSMKEAWRDFTISMLRDLSAIISKMVILNAFKAGIGFFTPASQPQIGPQITGRFKNGGIVQGGLTSMMPIRAFSKGGVVNRPTVAISGEAGMNEAFVPLPDGRRIPVALEGGTGGGDTFIINMNVVDMPSFIGLLNDPAAKRSVMSWMRRARDEGTFS